MYTTSINKNNCPNAFSLFIQKLTFYIPNIVNLKTKSQNNENDVQTRNYYYPGYPAR